MGKEKLTLVHAGEPLPTGASVFLAGPTPRSADVPSWRPAAIGQLAAQWQGPGKLAVLIPEPPGGQRFAYYDDQVQWETDARAEASAILFWIPRDLRTLPGFHDQRGIRSRRHHGPRGARLPPGTAPTPSATATSSGSPAATASK